MADEDFGMSKESMVDEEKFLTKNTMESPIFPRSGPVPSSVAAQKVINFATQWPPTGDPFMPTYAYANTWVPKKENKGKKDRPVGPSRPSIKGEIAL
jgi:hypothetical protein